MERIIEALAVENGYRAEFHDGLCNLIPLERGLLPWRDAPLEDVIEYFKHPLDERARRELWDGLALDRFDVVGCIRNRSGVTILMRAKEGGPTPWCVQHLGGGRYFRDFNSAAIYATARYGGKRMDKRSYTELEEARRRHLKDGTPLRDLL